MLKFGDKHVGGLSLYKNIIYYVEIFKISYI